MSTRPSVAPVSARRRGASALGRGVMLMQGLAGHSGFRRGAHAGNRGAAVAPARRRSHEASILR